MLFNWQSAAKLRIGEGSTTIHNGVHRKLLAVEAVGPYRKGEDIVCAHAERLRPEMGDKRVASLIITVE